MTPDERRAATEDLYGRYRVAVLAWAYGGVRDWHDAEDVAQQVWVNAHRSVDRLDGRGVTAWLQRTCRNAAIDCVRARQRHARFRSPQHPDWWTDREDDGERSLLPAALIDHRTPELAVVARDEADRLLAAVCRDGHPDWAWHLAHMARTGASESATAQHFGVPLGTLKTRIRLVQRRARAEQEAAA